MKKLNPYMIGGAAIIILLVILLIKQCNRSKPDIIATTDDSTQYWKNKAGNLTASQKRLENDFGIMETRWKDSIAKVYNTKTKYIKEIVTVTQEGKTEIVTREKPVITYVDSGGAMKNVFQMFESPYYIAEATIDLTGKDSSTLKLETIDTLTVLWKTVKEGGIFNRKTFLQVDVSNANPYNHIIGVTAYRVPQKVSRWNKWIKPTLVGLAASAVTYQVTKK